MVAITYAIACRILKRDGDGFLIYASMLDGCFLIILGILAATVYNSCKP